MPLSLLATTTELVVKLQGTNIGEATGNAGISILSQNGGLQLLARFLVISNLALSNSVVLAIAFFAVFTVLGTDTVAILQVVSFVPSLLVLRVLFAPLSCLRLDFFGVLQIMASALFFEDLGV